MNELKQNRLFVKRSFRFDDCKLFYTVSALDKENELAIPFEQIIGEKVSFKSSISLFIIISLSLFSSAIALQSMWFVRDDIKIYLVTVMSILATISLALYLITRNSFWRIELVSGFYILFHKNSPSKEETDKFIQSLFVARNAYLIENYARIDKNLSYEGQLENIKWLKAIGAISNETFLEKYEELKDTINPDNYGIGFGKESLLKEE